MTLFGLTQYSESVVPYEAFPRSTPVRLVFSHGLLLLRGAMHFSYMWALQDADAAELGDFVSSRALVLVREMLIKTAAACGCQDVPAKLRAKDPPQYRRICSTLHQSIADDRPLRQLLPLMV